MNKFKVLEKSGFNSYADGSVLLTGSAELLYKKWNKFLEQLFAPYKPARIKPSVFIEQEVIKKSKYLEHFPQQLFIARGKFLTPAACLHVYSLFDKQRLDKAKLYNTYITASCSRYENNTYSYPYRLPNFTMTEFVVIGDQKKAEVLRSKITEKLQKLFTDFKFDGEFVLATDAFFLENDSGARLIQKLKGLKQEYIVGKDKVAVASINNHEDYFSKCFKIRNTDKQIVHSFCVAFGIERLVAYSLLAWGNNEKKWPKQFTKYA